MAVDVAAAVAILDRLRRDALAVFGADLLGLYVHGSWVAGDFEPARSDLDLLAVLAADPTGETAATLGAVHAALARDEPAWADRIEVEYLSVAALTTFRTDPRPMVRISPGEPLHLTPATAHYVLNWYAARGQGSALHGPPPRDLLPEIPRAEFAAAVREHARQWPEWVADMRTPGSQAYAVLTLCRALFALTERTQLSKRAAASWAAAELPRWTGLIRWAARWWYEGGSDAEPDRLPEVATFVAEVARSAQARSSPGRGAGPGLSWGDRRATPRDTPGDG